MFAQAQSLLQQSLAFFSRLWLFLMVKGVHVYIDCVPSLRAKWCRRRDPICVRADRGMSSRCKGAFLKRVKEKYRSRSYRKLQVTVSLLSGKRFAVDISEDVLVFGVKKALEAVTGVHALQQRLLTSSAIELANSSRMLAWGLEDGSALQLLLESPMEIFVRRSFSQHATMYKLCGTDSVQHLKNMVAVREGLPPCIQRFWFNHTELPNHHTLHDCGVFGGSKLTLLPMCMLMLTSNDIANALAAAAAAVAARNALSEHQE